MEATESRFDLYSICLTKYLLKGTGLPALMLAGSLTLSYAFSSETQEISRKKI